MLIGQVTPAHVYSNYITILIGINIYLNILYTSFMNYMYTYPLTNFFGFKKNIFHKIYKLFINKISKKK